MKRTLASAILALLCSTSHAAIVDTTDAATIAAFQNGLTVVNFDAVAGRTPQTIASYTSGDPVDVDSFIFDQIGGVQFSVGGNPGTNAPALYELTEDIADDAQSGAIVLGPVDFDFTTKFNNGALIEIFFPAKVSAVGFWLNPSLGNVLLIAADTNFAFSGLPETALESGIVTAGSFVGIQRASADIGGFKIIALDGTGFSIDDFSFGAATTTVPEPSTWALLMIGFAALGFGTRRERKG